MQEKKKNKNQDSVSHTISIRNILLEILFGQT